MESLVDGSGLVLTTATGAVALAVRRRKRFGETEVRFIAACDGVADVFVELLISSSGLN